MDNNFWQELKRPILALAPMAGITDSPFRRICLSYGADVLYSEMASVSALKHAPEKTIKMLAARKSEKPYVVQLFGSDPKEFAIAAKLISAERKNFKASGLDINFGCPVAKVMKQGAGAKLFQNFEQSRAVIEATLENTDLPVSVKVRTVAGEARLTDFLDYLADLPIAAMMIHGRTLKQGFAGPIDFQVIKEARKHFKGVILANGHIKTKEQALITLKETLADGLGLATGVLGKPWLFSEIKSPDKVINPPEGKDLTKLILQHAKMVKDSGGNFLEFRKHLIWYVSGRPDAAAWRKKLMTVSCYNDLKSLIKSAPIG